MESTVDQGRVSTFPMTPMARMSSPQGRTLGLLPAEESLEPLTVHCVKVLGKGRAAEARLVHVGLEDGRTVRCVEKVFCPGLLPLDLPSLFSVRLRLPI